MKLPLTPKSFIKSPSRKPSSPSEESLNQAQPNTDFITQTPQRPASQSDTRFKSYLKLFPENKRKNNISLFNFFINKQPKKSQSNQKLDEPQHKEQKRYKQQQSIIIKRVKPPLSSLSTQKLHLIPTSSKQKFQKFMQKTNLTKQETSPQKEKTDRNQNKINESLVKNTKFDRKKYMYYRYRKKNSPQKNNLSFNQLCENYDIQQARPSRVSFNEMIIKTDEQDRNIDENEHNFCVEYKYSFLGVLPAKNKSFSQVKCKLTIQPIARQTSYKLVDKKPLSKTTRQARHKKQPSQNQDKIFIQAIHFKSRKTTHSRSKFAKENPQKHKPQRNQQPILGWNLKQQTHMQDQYF